MTTIDPLLSPNVSALVDEKSGDQSCMCTFHLFISHSVNRAISIMHNVINDGSEKVCDLN